MKVNALIASFAGAQRRRAGHARRGIANGLLVPEVARALVPALVVVALLAVGLAAAMFLPPHPLVLVALWAGSMGLLIAVPYAVVRAAGAVFVALER